MADITQTAANVINATATVASGIAGETVTAGMVLYLKAADSRLWKAQCDGAAAEAVAVGIALHAALAGQPLSYASAGPINIGGTTSKATVYVVSAAAGAVAPLADLTSGQYITQLGYATATDGSFVVKIVSHGVTV
jgi:hypothetical protein